MNLGLACWFTADFFFNFFLENKSVPDWMMELPLCTRMLMIGVYSPSPVCHSRSIRRSFLDFSRRGLKWSRTLKRTLCFSLWLLVYVASTEACSAYFVDVVTFVTVTLNHIPPPCCYLFACNSRVLLLTFIQAQDQKWSPEAQSRTVTIFNKISLKELCLYFLCLCLHFQI